MEGGAYAFGPWREVCARLTFRVSRHWQFDWFRGLAFLVATLEACEGQAFRNLKGFRFPVLTGIVLGRSPKDCRVPGACAGAVGQVAIHENHQHVAREPVHSPATLHASAFGLSAVVSRA